MHCLCVLVRLQSMGWNLSFSRVKIDMKIGDLIKIGSEFFDTEGYWLIVDIDRDVKMSKLVHEWYIILMNDGNIHELSSYELEKICECM